MDVVSFNRIHYPELVSWWKSYGWMPPSIDALASQGFIAVENGAILAAAFIYQTCSSIAFMDWIVAKKNQPKETRQKAVKSVIEACKQYAKDEGYDIVYTITANIHMQDTYRSLGFKDMEKNAVSMAFNIKANELEFLK
jgi:hypothetical protein